ncbi:MAG: alkaline phosphatase family protein [Chitinophagaceae bacterium]|nr:alkaline phosphatase family protein [Chitinophagaceae bacterium]MBL0200210.1 alkaline phosphatase family protein [Chitinophagaceae bacterium]
MLRRSLLFFTFYFFTVGVFAQTAQQGSKGKPKLVVGLVVDQMRWDYLYRFNALYGEGGFKRMLKEGFSSENNFIPYVPTYTAVGHTCIYTGSVPALTGIVGNNWFDKTTGKGVYCTDDSTVSTVGNSGRAGKMSPANLWVTTITDELRLSNNFKSKVIGIALKDRGAILPAGHSANAAYWYDAGKWITSTHYMNAMPAWVDQFNAKDLPGKYMSKDWTTLLPMDKYDLSTEDDKSYESNIKGEKTVTFPHKLSAISDSFKYESFRTTPFANTFTFDFAKAAIENESLGKNTVTDFLAVSISSTDYIGHNFGPNSVEVEDMYLRLDKDIAEFLLYLDTKLGKGNYTIFLSADHAVAHIPAFLAEHKIPGGNFEDGDLRIELNKMIETDFGVTRAVQSLQNYQVYLNINELEKQGKDVASVKKAVIKALQAKPFIITAFETDKLALTTLPEPQKTMLANGYNTKRSGDIQFTLKPGYFDGGKKGTTHGLWNPYDAHIPCVFFGWGVKPGKTNRETYMTDIAPTIAALLQIQMPNGSVGKVITELVK